MRHRLLSTLLFAAALAGCEGNARMADDGPRFPEPDRPVSELGSNQFSTEDQRDSRGEASTVMELAEIAEGMTVADIGAGNGYYTFASPTRRRDRSCWHRISTARLARLAAGWSVAARQCLDPPGEPADPRCPPTVSTACSWSTCTTRSKATNSFGVSGRAAGGRAGHRGRQGSPDRPARDRSAAAVCELERSVTNWSRSRMRRNCGLLCTVQGAATRPEPGEIELCRGERTARRRPSAADKREKA